ncbi:MAG: type I-C CRISPR-associated protein Cas8c/Csd1 [Parabacteroides sp.]|nr:type I-C CRISPR-associated protein Cas8c/Csd1 [Parabacteroides sp.]
MFAELVELGRRVRKGHEALGEIECNWDIIIDIDGNYKGLIPYNNNKKLVSEYIPSTAKRGKERFLLDKADFTLGYENSSESQSNHKKYIKKLKQYEGLSILDPVFSFYNKPEEVKKALAAFNALPKSKQTGNLTFMYEHNHTRPLSLNCVQDAIKKHFEEGIKDNKNNDICSVCGKTDYPIVDKPHGGVSLPGSDKSCSLVSYNENAFESYNLKGNLNSGICTNCARNYIEGLAYLTKFEWLKNDKGKNYKKYDHAFELSDDTLVVFWTKYKEDDIDPDSDVYQPTEERVRNLFLSIAAGEYQKANTKVDNYFYCCTISSAAARIAVRDWLAISVTQYQKNLKQWFDDIATIKDGETYYPGINSILNSCIKKKTKSTQSDLKAKARIGAVLWHAALTNTALPLMILQSVLTQIEHNYFSPEKSTVIRLVLNRNIKSTYYMKKELDEQNDSKAYLCGRLFALICQLQYKAHEGKEVNSSIRDRFFTSASCNPSRVMGKLLTEYVPIYQKKTKGAYTKSITEIASRIGCHFPDKLTLTERGEFALGYYYQYAAKKNENSNDND